MSDIGWVFVYGSLRPNGILHDVIKHALAMPPFAATAHGAMYHVEGSTPQDPQYPVVDFKQKGTVVGALLLVHWLPVRRVRTMEQQVGYHEVLVPVRVNGWHHTTEALAFHWPHPFRGEPVPDGDWAKVWDHAILPRHLR